MVFLPDTQYYSASNRGGTPAMFNAMTQWIANNVTNYNIRAVLHEGDVVDDDIPAQWVAGSAAMAILDVAEMPYLTAIGNHDYSPLADPSRTATSFNANFPQSRYTAHGWWSGGFYEAGHTENSYLLLTAEGRDYILLNLEYGARNAVLAWADALLTTYAARKAIIVTHNFMYIDGTRTGTGDHFNPHLEMTEANDGDEMWTKLVKLHDNILWVQSGHQWEAYAARRSDNSDGGSPVAQILANWQADTNGGDGWLRIVTFGASTIKVKTYSPTLGEFDTAAAHQFMVTL